jgi:hypothetical protein
MSVRRLSLVAAVAMAGVVAAGCAEQSAGLRVGDETFSQSEVFDELDLISPLIDPDGQVTRGELADSYNQQFVAGVLQQRIDFVLAEQIFEEQGLELTDAERTASEDQLVAQFGQAWDALAEEDRAALVDDVARILVLQRELGPAGFDGELRQAKARSDISVSSRFGRWDAENLAVVPPAGPDRGPQSAEGLGLRDDAPSGQG